MSTYKLPFGQSIGYKHDHPERTARRTGADGWDVFYQVWTNRKAMARSIRMQQKGPPSRRDWTALVQLTDLEGY